MLDDSDSGHGTPSDATLRERDRALGRRLADTVGDEPLALVMAWKCEREREAGVTDSSGAMSAVTMTVALAGLVLGGLTASGAFFYDGTARVNVLLLLGLFVALPVATLGLFALACATRNRLGIFNPGRVGALIGRILPSECTRALARLTSGSRGPDVARWLILSWSQVLALGFAIGTLGAALMLVVFTDLAFGWSTTLDLDAAAVRRMVESLALPWRELAPAGVPSRELVENTRYFRLSADTPVAEPQHLGRWWPFVVMAILVYATLPRLCTTALSRWRLSRACGQSLLADPRVAALIRRMTTPLVETRANDTETRASPESGDIPFLDLPKASTWQLVNWAEVPVERQPLEQVLRPARLLGIHPAGGTRSTTEDRDLADILAEAPADSGVLVLARGFDPPTLDLVDFLRELRSRVPVAIPVAILPVALTDGAPSALAARHTQVWSNALAHDAATGILAVTLQPSPSQLGAAP